MTPLLVSLATSIVFQQQPHAPLANPAAPPKEVTSWKEIAADAIGPVRPLLVDHPELRVAATKHVQVDTTKVGQPSLLVAMSKSPHAAFLTFLDGKIQLRTFDCNSGAISEPITTVALDRPPTVFDEGPDGASVILRATPDTPLFIYDIPAGTLRATIEPDLAGRGAAFVIDDSTLAVVSEDGTIRRFSTIDGSNKSTVQGPPMRTFAGVRGHVIGVTFKDPPNAPGVQAARKLILASINAETGKEAGRAEVVAGPAAASPIAPTIAIAEASAGWNALRILDGVTLADVGRHPIAPNVASYALGIELSGDGTLLYMTEYMTQAVIAWETASGAPRAVFGPELGGCVHMDVANAAPRMVAIVGPWNKGVLVPDAFEVFDLAARPAPAATTAPAPR